MKNDAFKNKKGKLVAGFNQLQSCWENTCHEKMNLVRVIMALLKVLHFADLGKRIGQK